jgi:uncharacterized membrane protein
VDLGWLVPEISLLSAAGYRIRRNYGYLFLVTLVAWALRLEGLAGPGAGLREVVAEARIGAGSGALVAGTVGAAALAGSVLAFFAPSERMRGWTAVPPPLTRWHRPGTHRPGD